MLKNLWVSQKRQQAGFRGDRLRGVVSRLFPYSNYKLEMVVVNGRGDGPRSETKEFTTPEGGRCGRSSPGGAGRGWHDQENLERLRRGSDVQIDLCVTSRRDHLRAGQPVIDVAALMEVCMSR